MSGYWAKEFSSRVIVQSGILRIVLPLDHVINITSINQLKISNWLEIEGMIEYPQKNLSIPYNARPSPADCVGYFNTTGSHGNTGILGCTASCKDTEKKR